MSQEMDGPPPKLACMLLLAQQIEASLASHISSLELGNNCSETFQFPSELRIHPSLTQVPVCRGSCKEKVQHIPRSNPKGFLRLQAWPWCKGRMNGWG